MANQVVLTFAGDTQNLEKSFDRAGNSAQTMGHKAEEGAGGLHKVGEAADTVDTRAMGFRDTITGVQDSMTGWKKLTSGQGSVGDALFQLGAGIGDLGSGMYNFLIPAIKKAAASTLAQTVASKAAAIGARAWAATQWLVNAAMSANPIGIVIVAIVALVGVIYLIATRTHWFQQVWGAAWGFIKSAASNAWSFIRQIPGWIGSAFSGIASTISGPFRSAFNFIADAWNNTVGQLSFSIPDWIPGIGGNGFSVPKLPHFHAGGVVPGAVGTNVLTMLQAGERVSSAAGGGGDMVIRLSIGSTQLGDVIVDTLRGAVRTRGGNVQAVLGRG